VRSTYKWHYAGKKIAYPLTEEQFKDFKTEIATAENVKQE
jgi:hypothetical protein